MEKTYNHNTKPKPNAGNNEVSCKVGRIKLKMYLNEGMGLLGLNFKRVFLVNVIISDEPTSETEHYSKYSNINRTIFRPLKQVELNIPEMIYGDKYNANKEELKIILLFGQDTRKFLILEWATLKDKGYSNRCRKIMQHSGIYFYNQFMKKKVGCTGKNSYNLLQEETIEKI